MTPYRVSCLFLAMEGLHIAIEDVVARTNIKGVSIGCSEIKISDVFYPYDALFLTEWSRGDVEGIVQVLQEFYNSLGLN